ncbi:MAG: SynChlorMet cassette radical SAM/SPASM protein ScmE [Deltaproteobacteria bacterium]|nr:SynChlorMet cassette radical SAM/SPASM protein ScmE [Deltaproteobacteria bacterium]
MSTPRRLDIEITARCNLRCRYCYFFDNPAVPYRDLDTATWLRFFDELGACQVMDVCISGGEPFLRPDLPELLAGIVRNRMRFNLVSNGALIDDAKAAAVAATRRCNYVQISVDGSCADTHDVCRGPGSFAGALRGIRTLQRHGIPVAARVTIHRHNVRDLPAVARLLLDELEVPAFSTNAASELGSFARHADQIAMTVADRELAMRSLVELKERYGGRITANAGPLADAEYWARMETARRQGAPAFSDGGRLSACGCVFEKIAVRADGAIVPCSMLAHLELGRIGRDRLAEVWRSAPELVRLRARQAIPLQRFAGCRDCAYAPYCTGNCPGLAYSLTGEIDRPSPDACLRLFLEAGGAIDGRAARISPGAEVAE